VSAGLVVGLTLAYGAAVTSLGLALATWVSRLGRAVALAVAAYVFVCIGWLFLVITLLSRNDTALGLASASPLFGIGILTDLAMHPGRMRNMDLDVRTADAVWLAIYLAGAAVLYLATRETFDRRLGRMTPGPARPRPDGADRVLPRPTTSTPGRA
jgi:hypothetical protein